MRPDALRDTPTLHGATVTLRPLGPEHAAATFRAVQEPESRRLTGTHAEFTAEQIERWCATRAEQPDRLDLAIERRTDGTYVGEVVLNDLDPHNESVSFRIGLAGPEHFGRGYGTEATMLVLRYAFATVGLHRVGLEVYAFNGRAAHVYARCGFEREGVLRDALRSGGERHDAVLMAALRPEWLARFGADPAVAG